MVMRALCRAVPVDRMSRRPVTSPEGGAVEADPSTHCVPEGARRKVGGRPLRRIFRPKATDPHQRVALSTAEHHDPPATEVTFGAASACEPLFPSLASSKLELRWFGWIRQGGVSKRLTPQTVDPRVKRPRLRRDSTQSERLARFLKFLGEGDKSPRQKREGAKDSICFCTSLLSSFAHQSDISVAPSPPRGFVLETLPALPRELERRTMPPTPPATEAAFGAAPACEPLFPSLASSKLELRWFGWIRQGGVSKTIPVEHLWRSEEPRQRCRPPRSAATTRVALTRTPEGGVGRGRSS